MKITERAREEILKIMKGQGLDPNAYFFYICGSDTKGGCALEFTPKEEIGKRYDFGELRVIQGLEIEPSLVIDCQVINGRKGLIFMGEHF